MEQLFDFCTRAYDFIKPIIVLILSAIISVILPVKEVLILLLSAAFFNWFIGYMTDIHVNAAKFSIKKAFEAITQILLYGGLATFIKFSFFMLGDDVTGETIVKYMTYIVIYYYVVNILKNSKEIYPKSKALKLMYEILTTQIYQELKSRLKFKQNEVD